MYFPIGDIHGNYDVLVLLLEKIEDYIQENCKDEENAIIFLGDYIDRGHQNKKVLDLLMDMRKHGKGKIVCLQGNHDIMPGRIRYPLNDDEQNAYIAMWLRHGGTITLAEFGCDIQGLIDGEADKYVNWLYHLPQIYITDDFVFVHAGINFDHPLDEQLEQEILWEFGRKYERNTPKIVVHGHSTHVNGPKFVTYQGKLKAIGLDVGAYFKNRLCSVALPLYGYFEERLDVIEAKL